MTEPDGFRPHLAASHPCFKADPQRARGLGSERLARRFWGMVRRRRRCGRGVVWSGGTLVY